MASADSGDTARELFCEAPGRHRAGSETTRNRNLPVLEQIHRLKTDQRVIVLTGAGAAETEAEVRALSAVKYLEKDKSFYRVAESVKQVLNTEHLPRR